jgi:DNA-binding transcriptional ArsR family regulator
LARAIVRFAAGRVFPLTFGTVQSPRCVEEHGDGVRAGVRNRQVRLAVAVQVADHDRERAASGPVVALGPEAAVAPAQEHGDGGRAAVRGRQVRLESRPHRGPRGRQSRGSPTSSSDIPARWPSRWHYRPSCLVRLADQVSRGDVANSQVTTRLQIVSLLAAAEWADFAFIRDQLDLSDSALSKQLSMLEEAGYLVIECPVSKRRRRVRARLTPVGRERFIGHVAVLREMIAAAAADA